MMMPPKVGMATIASLSKGFGAKCVNFAPT